MVTQKLMMPEAWNSAPKAVAPNIPKEVILMCINIIKLLEERMQESLSTTFSFLVLVKISWVLVCLFTPRMEILLS